MRLEELGRTRGQANQPPSEAKEFDHLEASIIERVEEIRRKGLENFETNRRVYSERLARAGYATQEVNVAAGTAKGDFGKLVQFWQSTMEESRERLNDTFRWRLRYKELHRLERPAKVFEGWVKAVSLAIILIVVESAFNAYLFSQGNEFGLLGGLLAAFIVSAVNVGSSTMLGYFARHINCRNWFLKLLGLLCILAWVSLSILFSLAVAHFRDGLDAGVAWRVAAEAAVPALLETPFYLASIESWLLVVISLLVSVLSFLKGWHTDDPYPGYGRLERSVRHARDTYVSNLENALEELGQRRDDAISELRDASEQVRQGIGEAVDALFGQSTLGAHLAAFLDQCDVKVAYLLAVYRDANRAARSTPSPKCFDKGYRFPSFKLPTVETSRRETAEAEAARVTATVENAVQDIFEQFDSARKAFDVTRIVQGEAAPVRNNT